MSESYAWDWAGSKAPVFLRGKAMMVVVTRSKKVAVSRDWPSNSNIPLPVEEGAGSVGRGEY
jgi:hypothetical protein